MVGLSAPSDGGGGGGGGDGGGGGGVLRDLAALVDVLGEPAEALAVALPLQHTAHEHLQWSRVQLLHGNVALREKQEKKVTLNSLSSFFPVL